ncbi:MAG: hypothetical protein Q8P81_02435 [Nanoarchaeota archaeon]|nr:hypothetical protein [Nanoarchaeota archaeon]
MKSEEKAEVALRYIMPLLKKYNFKWCISGSFACYLYGVKRPIGDIDIDVEADEKDKDFRSLVNDVKGYTTDFPFQLWIDENYDNWVMNVVVSGQLLSICSTKNLKLFNKEKGEYGLFYENGKIPTPRILSFRNIKIPISQPEYVIRMKEALAVKKQADKKDISEMKKLLNTL